MVALVACAVVLLGLVDAATIEHWWNISYATANPDGVSDVITYCIVCAFSRLCQYTMFQPGKTRTARNTNNPTAIRKKSHRRKRLMAASPSPTPNQSTQLTTPVPHPSPQPKAIPSLSTPPTV